MKEKNKKVTIKIPSRFHIDVMNIQKLEEGKVGGGGIGIAIGCNLNIYAEMIESEKDVIESNKPNLVRFYIELLRNYLKFNKKFYIRCQTDKELKSHSGMGLNALIQIGTTYAVNHLMERPLTEKELMIFLKDNYFEEENGVITRDVFCTGVVHNTSIHGGICFISEEGNLLYSKKMPKNVEIGVIKVVINDVFEMENLNTDEIVVNLRKNRDSEQGIRNKEKLIKNVMIKDLKENKYKSFIEGMKKFSKEDDSVAMSKRCKINHLQYNEFCEIIENIGNTFVRISSNSPYIYVITDCFTKIKKVCEEYNINVKKYKIDNSGIEINEV